MKSYNDYIKEINSIKLQTSTGIDIRRASGVTTISLLPSVIENAAGAPQSNHGIILTAGRVVGIDSKYAEILGGKIQVGWVYKIEYIKIIPDSDYNPDDPLQKPGMGFTMVKRHIKALNTYEFNNAINARAGNGIDLISLYANKPEMWLEPVPYNTAVMFWKSGGNESAAANKLNVCSTTPYRISYVNGIDGGCDVPSQIDYYNGIEVGVYYD